MSLSGPRTIPDSSQQAKGVKINKLQPEIFAGAVVIIANVAMGIYILGLILGSNIFTTPGGLAIFIAIVAILIANYFLGKMDWEKIKTVAKYELYFAIALTFIFTLWPNASVVNWRENNSQSKTVAHQQKRQVKSVADLTSSVEVGAEWVKIARVSRNCEFCYSSPKGFWKKDELGNTYYHNPSREGEVRAFRMSEVTLGTIIYVKGDDRQLNPGESFNIRFKIL